MKRAILNIVERALSQFLFTYAASAAVLAGGFGTQHDLQIAGAAALLSLAKNVTAYLSLQGNGPGAVDVSTFNDGGADPK